MIQWSKVTWYSQILAIFLALIIFCVGFYLGTLRGGVNVESYVPDNHVVKEENPVLFEGLDSEIENLPAMPSYEEWALIMENSGIFQDRITQGVAEYGDLAKRFYSKKEYEGYYIDVVYADVTNDGVPESIVSFDGGGTYGIIKYTIVSGDLIIATIEPSSVGRSGALKPDINGNGFSMIWYTNDMFPNGYCCPVEKMVTDFVYENGEFSVMKEERIKT